MSECWDPDSGVPQGGVLSPLLANFYLAPFDRTMVAAGYQLVRYVDDLVVLTKSREEAELAYALCRDTLAGLGLTIHAIDIKDGKGRVKHAIVNPNESFDFLGIRFNKTSLQPCQSKIDDLRNRIKGITDGRDCTATLLDVVGRLNRLLRGWIAAHSFCNIARTLIDEIDNAAGVGVSRWMSFKRITPKNCFLTRAHLCSLGLLSVSTIRINPISDDLRESSARRWCNLGRRYPTARPERRCGAARCCLIDHLLDALIPRHPVQPIGSVGGR